MTLRATTWQTVGPFFKIGLAWLYREDLAGAGVSGEHIEISGRVLDEGIADRDHQVGVVEPRHLVVTRLQPDGSQRVRILVVEQSLAHEGFRHRDPAGVDEGS